MGFGAVAHLQCPRNSSGADCRDATGRQRQTPNGGIASQSVGHRPNTRIPKTTIGQLCSGLEHNKEEVVLTVPGAV
jgi:hypothetical protein